MSASGTKRTSALGLDTTAAEPGGKLLPTAKSTSLPKAKSTSVAARLWAHSRLFVSLIVGIVVGVFVPLDGIMLRILAGWNAAGWLYIALLGVMMFRCEVVAYGIKQAWKRKAEVRSLS